MLLSSCLESLVQQSHKPNGVTVVDNGSSDNTRRICNRFKKSLNLTYAFEKTIGLPYARNTSIQQTKADILAFIDDDCVASPDWMYTINKHFSENPEDAGIIGFTKNMNPKNVNSVVEYAFYLRWILQNVHDLNQPEMITSGVFIDFKNAAFKRSVFDTIRFATKVPSGDAGMMEDVEVGKRILRQHPNICYIPDMNVLHRYSVTLKRLIIRNFWEGYGNQNLAMGYRLNIRSTPYHISATTFLLQCLRGEYNKFINFSLEIYVLFLLFPFVSKLGRLYFSLTHRFRLSVQIPQRK